MKYGLKMNGWGLNLGFYLTTSIPVIIIAENFIKMEEHKSRECFYYKCQGIVAFEDYLSNHNSQQEQESHRLQQIFTNGEDEGNPCTLPLIE